jgi:response regulator RpfG family c-di-GMP phosphodiesterase
MSEPTAPDTDAENAWLLEEDDDETAAAAQGAPDQRRWRVLIVDDDVDVHAVTRLALRNVSFKGRALELFSAYSGQQAYEVLAATDDIALVLLDVVMETDDAGLVLVKRIREELNNPIVRIVLRTGQPGQAPEQRVIIEYDINDYKAKTELTTQKLFTTVISALRAYESLLMLERSRVGLSKILAGATNLYQIRSLREFASGVLNQVSAILDVGADGVLCLMQDGCGEPTVVAATGNYAALAESEALPTGHPLSPAIGRAFTERRSQFEHPANVLFIDTDAGRMLCMSVTPPWPLAPIQRDLLEVFCQRIGAAFDNLHMFERLRQAHDDAVAALSKSPGAAGQRGSGGGQSRRGGLPGRQPATLAEAIVAELKRRRGPVDAGLATLRHETLTHETVRIDVGRSTSQEHRAVHRAAASQFGEAVDGVRPQHASDSLDQLDLPELPFAARIVTVAETFEAMLYQSAGMDPWPHRRAMAYMREGSGTRFDPDVVEALASVVEQRAAGLFRPTESGKPTAPAV